MHLSLYDLRHQSIPWVVRAWSTLARDKITPVGPVISCPWTGDTPSESGVPAKRPSGMNANRCLYLNSAAISSSTPKMYEIKAARIHMPLRSCFQ
jgi:hypothetical protein